MTWDWLETPSVRRKLTIGTEDDNVRCGRAAHERGMPKRLEDFYWQRMIEGDTVDWFERGLGVSIPRLKAGELVQVHFVVAWASPEPGEEQDDVSTWYAVDPDPVEVPYLLGIDSVERCL